TRGIAYGPGCSFNGSTVPFRSITAICGGAEPAAITGPETYNSEPVSETLKSAAPKPAACSDVAAPVIRGPAPLPVARLTPSMIGTASPVTLNRCTSNVTANTRPLSAYARCPVGRYRASLPPLMTVVRCPDAIDWTTT